MSIEVEDVESVDKETSVPGVKRPTPQRRKKASDAPKADAPKAEEPKKDKKHEEPKKEKKKQPSKEEALQKELDELKQTHLRVLAEYDNYRKRSTKEKEAAWSNSKAAVLEEILPIIDTFERALAADGDYDSLKKGMDMIYTNFLNVFEKLGAKAFGEPGDTFDPNIHNAVMHIEDEEHGEGEIVAVFSKGYKIGDKVVRPAMVQVAN